MTPSDGTAWLALTAVFALINMACFLAGVVWGRRRRITVVIVEASLGGDDRAPPNPQVRPD